MALREAPVTPTQRPARLTAPFAMRESLVRACGALSARGLLAGRDGNVSVRLAADRLLVTPSGFAKGELDPDDLVEVSADGTHLAGRHAATSELGLHLTAYTARPDVNAVVHAHPVHATAFTLVGETLPDGLLAELMLTVGPVALAPYAQPGTDEVGRGAAGFFAGHDAILLAHHGAVTVGRSLQEAQFAMESLEHGARMIHVARQLGRVVTLEDAAQQRLREARRGARMDAASGAALKEKIND